jgi:flagellar biosynthesis protein FlhG
VVVAGGKPDSGVTTLAVNLAVALARQGRRAVLVDADLEREATPLFAHTSGQGTIVDVLAGRNTVHEVLERGPSGIQVVGGTMSPVSHGETSSTASERLIGQLRDLAPHAEVVVIDVGSGHGQLAQAMWHAADVLVVVTTAESESIMDAYAAIKALARTESGPPLHVIVNQTDDGRAAADVQGRIAEACRRFLGLETQAAGHVPICSPGGSGTVTVFPPRGDSARAMDRAADTLWAQLQVGAGGASSRQARRA